MFEAEAKVNLELEAEDEAEVTLKSRNEAIKCERKKRFWSIYKARFVIEINNP